MRHRLSNQLHSTSSFIVPCLSQRTLARTHKATHPAIQRYPDVPADAIAVRQCNAGVAQRHSIFQCSQVALNSLNEQGDALTQQAPHVACASTFSRVLRFAPISSCSWPFGILK